MEELPDLHIQRPYASLDEYLEGDFWTVERKEMFLIGAPQFDQGVAVKFTIELADGTAVVTGEGRVVEHTAPSDEFPGGLKVRFRQLDADAKAVLRRALELRRAYAAAMASEAPPPADATPPADAPPPTDATPPADASPPTDATPPTPATPPSPTPVTSHPPSPALSPSPAPDAPLAVAPPSPVVPRPVSTSAPPKPRLGTRPRSAVRVVAAPPNRDALLGRLRERARRFTSASGAPRWP